MYIFTNKEILTLTQGLLIVSSIQPNTRDSRLIDESVGYLSWQTI